MYNLRYHVASLVAAFLFLSVGLLLGTIVAERGVLDTSRDTMINSLRVQFEEISAENRDLRTTSDAHEDFINDTRTLLVEGRLDGKTVVVLSSEERADALTPVSEAIARAGGTVAVVPVAMSDLGLDDPLVSTEARVAIGTVPELADSEDDLATMVTRALALEWSTPSMTRPMTHALSSAGVFDVTQLPSGVAIDSVVILTSWDGVPDETVVTLGRQLFDLEIPVSAVEVSTQPNGLAIAAVERGLSAVEEVGTPESDFSLVMIMSGRASGYFGPGENAAARYPVIVTEE